MDESPDEPVPSESREDLAERLESKEARKLKARRSDDRTVWFGLGLFGVIGWSVAIPTLLGVALGIWLDSKAPGKLSWTLTMLLAGATLGCLNAWFWVTKEQAAMDQQAKRPPDE